MDIRSGRIFNYCPCIVDFRAKNLLTATKLSRNKNVALSGRVHHLKNKCNFLFH
jgi:hypothetical protein